MRAFFATSLVSEDLDGNRSRLVEPLVYFSKILMQYLTLPRGFEADSYSAPQTPFGSWMVRGLDRRPAFVHDWLYSPESGVDRETADRVLLEAMEAVGISWWRRRLIYRAVRVGGGFFYKGTLDEIVAPPDPDGA